MSEIIKYKMRCQTCKRVVPYMADDYNGDFYKAVRNAVEKRKHFAFKDWCGFCDKETTFAVVYPAWEAKHGKDPEKSAGA